MSLYLQNFVVDRAENGPWKGWHHLKGPDGDDKAMKVEHRIFPGKHTAGNERACWVD